MDKNLTSRTTVHHVCATCAPLFSPFSFHPIPGLSLVLSSFHVTLISLPFLSDTLPQASRSRLIRYIRRKTGVEWNPHTRAFFRALAPLPRAKVGGVVVLPARRTRIRNKDDLGENTIAALYLYPR